MKRCQHHPLVRNRQQNFSPHLHLANKGKTKVVRAQIDSASTCNTIPEESLHKLFPSIKISKSKASISTYGNQILHPKGQVTLCCERRGKFHTLNFLVVDVPQEKPPLLSGSDAQALQFLKIFADEVHMADNVVKSPPSHQSPNRTSFNTMRISSNQGVGSPSETLCT